MRFSTRKTSSLIKTSRRQEFAVFLIRLCSADPVAGVLCSFFPFTIYIEIFVLCERDTEISRVNTSEMCHFSLCLFTIAKSKSKEYSVIFWGFFFCLSTTLKNPALKTGRSSRYALQSITEPRLVHPNRKHTLNANLPL